MLGMSRTLAIISRSVNKILEDGRVYVYPDKKSPEGTNFFYIRAR